MIQMPWLQIETSPYDNRIRPHPYNTIAPEAENLRYAEATHSHLLPPTIPRFDVAHAYNNFQHSDPSFASHHGELNPPPRLTHQSYSFLPAGSEPSDDTPTGCSNLGFPQASEIYNQWGSFHPLPDLLPNVTYDASPSTLHHATLDPTLYSNVPCRQSPWPTGNVQVGSVDEFLPIPGNYHPPAPPHNVTPDPHLDYTPEFQSGTLDASYPCLWMENGAVMFICRADADSGTDGPDHIISEVRYKLNFKHHWYAHKSLIADSASRTYEAYNVFVYKQVRSPSLSQRIDVKLLTSSGASGTPLRRDYTSTSWQQNVPIIGNSSCSELYWTGKPLRESYVPAGFASDTSSWPSTAFPGPSLSVYGGVWLGDQRPDEACLGSSFGAPGGNADRSGMDLIGMEVAAPMLEQAFPVAPRALPEFQPCPPSSLNWTQAPGPSWQSTSSWDHPVHAARQHGGQNSSIDSLAMRPEIPPFQLATSSGTTGRLERKIIPAGRLPFVPTLQSVQASTLSDPVSVAPSSSQSRGERWDPSNTSSFRCLWTNRGMRCTALIGGSRRSVTNHLRDEHNFVCDGQMIDCAWWECTAHMQRRNIPRHIVACHLAIKVPCSQCGLALSRADANKKHRLACTGTRTPVVVEASEEDEGGYASGVGAFGRAM
ncbi:hypothetical protein J3R83DRAFT_4283 [Lanmaoa asiatica]|nr:hypothetical protein J3R83DRAFT_4283 [Lanmaoa asiatica]